MTRGVRSGWWRRNGLWLLGACLMAALSIGVAWRDAFEDYRLAHRVAPIDVARGAWGHYEGARWRVVDSRTVIPTRRGSLHPDALVLTVRFEVLPDEGTSSDVLDRCKSEVADARGRTWNESTLLRIGVQTTLGRNCGHRDAADGLPEVAVPAHPFRFEHRYEIPASLPLTDVRPRLWITHPQRSKRGAYLQFEL